MVLRLSKIALVAAMGLFCLLAGFSNVTDYMANFPAMERVMEMKEIFPNSTIGYRAITSPLLHHAAFTVVMACELLTGLLCAWGAWTLFRARNESGFLFNHAKKIAIVGLTLGFLTWHVLFVSVGGEWFGMWMSQTFNGAIDTAFQIFITMLVVLVFVVGKDEDL